MDIAIILTITAAVAIYIALPFFLKKDIQEPDADNVPDPNEEDQTVELIQTLENQKESLFSAIKDIEFDYGLGKLSKEDYEELNNKYKVEAASVLKKIDETQKEDNSLGIDNIEQEVLLYRKERDNNQINDDQIEDEISAFRSASSINTLENMCSQCGAEHGSEDLFCSICGEKLK